MLKKIDMHNDILKKMIMVRNSKSGKFLLALDRGQLLFPIIELKIYIKNKGFQNWHIGKHILEFETVKMQRG